MLFVAGVCIGNFTTIQCHWETVWRWIATQKDTVAGEQGILFETPQLPQHLVQDFTDHSPYGLFVSAMQLTPLWETPVGDTEVQVCPPFLHSPLYLDQAQPAQPGLRGQLSTEGLFISHCHRLRQEGRKKNDDFTKPRCPPKNGFNLETPMFLVFLTKITLNFLFLDLQIFRMLFLGLTHFFSEIESKNPQEKNKALGVSLLTSVPPFPWCYLIEIFLLSPLSFLALIELFFKKNQYL